jgi:hypothetical protein
VSRAVTRRIAAAEGCVKAEMVVLTLLLTADRNRLTLCSYHLPIGVFMGAQKKADLFAGAVDAIFKDA